MNKIDNDTMALQIWDKLRQAGAISLHAGGASYLTKAEEIADTTSRRELEAILIRLGLFTPADHLTKQLSASLCSALTLQGIHLDQWLADRKYQSELNDLTHLLADYAIHCDMNANDTRLRIAVLSIAKTHAAELRSTLPSDSSIHAVRIANQSRLATGMKA